MQTVSVVSCPRQAIEGFALMVKKTAQTLQSFGTELAETELPNEIQATTILLSTHTTKKDKMKVKPLKCMCTLWLYFSIFTYIQHSALVVCFGLSTWAHVSVGGSVGGSGSGEQAVGEHQ